MSNAYEPEIEDDQEIEEEAVEAAPEKEEPVSDEARARAQGWKPFDEYRGDPRRWTDYPEFLRKGEEELPILRDQNRRMGERLARVEPEIAALKNTVAEQARAVKDAMALARKADQRGYERARAELLAQQRGAVAAGDTEVFDQVAEQLEALESTRAAVVTTEESEPPAAPAAPPMEPAIANFVRENGIWFNDRARPYLRQAVIGLHNAVIAEGELTDTGEQLAEAKRRLAVMYPNDPDLGGSVAREPAPRPRPRVAPSLTPRGPGAVPAARRSPFDRIEDPEERKEVRAAFENTKRHDPSVTEAEYVELYLDPRADVLSLRNKRK